MDFPKSVPGIGLVDGRFVDENPVTGQQGSLIARAWGNQLTDEILNVLAKAKAVATKPDDFEPSEEKNDQLANAINQLIANAVAGVGNSWNNLANKPNAITSLSNIITITSNTTLTNDQLGIVLINAGTGNIAVTLPLADQINKASHVILFRIDNSSNSVTIKPSTGQTINFNTDLVLHGVGDLLQLFSDGSGGWYSVTPTASQTQKGLVYIADQQDLNQLSTDDSAISPKGIATIYSKKLLSNNGYQILPSGLILQWALVGNGASISTDTTEIYSFPITFPTAVLGIFTTLQRDSNTTGNWGVYAKANSNSLFTVAYDGSSSSTIQKYVFILAIGI